MRSFLAKGALVLTAMLVVAFLADTGNAQRTRRESRGRAWTKAQVKAVINRFGRTDVLVNNTEL